MQIEWRTCGEDGAEAHEFYTIGYELPNVGDIVLVGKKGRVFKAVVTARRWVVDAVAQRQSGIIIFKESII